LGGWARQDASNSYGEALDWHDTLLAPGGDGHVTA